MNPNTTDSKTVYILQHHLPDVQKGAEFCLGKALDAYYLTSDKTGTGYNCYCYPKVFVENNPDWFKLKEAEEQKTFRVDDYMLNGHNFSVCLNKPVPSDKARSLNTLIENHLNYTQPVPDIPTLSRQDEKVVCNIESVHIPPFTNSGFRDKPKDTIQDKEINTKDVFHNFLNNGFITMQDYMKASNIDDDLIKLPPKEEVKPLPKQMWNKQCGIHDEQVLCMGHGCEEYNPLDKNHQLK